MLISPLHTGRFRDVVRVLGLPVLLVAAFASSARAQVQMPVSPYAVTRDFNLWVDNWNASGASGFHLGEDVVSAAGTAIHAMTAGTVRFAGSAEGYGAIVIVEHSFGAETVTSIYGHLSQQLGLQVSAGQGVNVGQVVGYTAYDNEDGGAWAPHLHFGVRKGPYSATPICGFWPYVGYSFSCSGVTHQDYVAMWHDPSDFIASHRPAVGDWNGDGVDAVWTFGGGLWTIPASDAGGTQLQFTMGVPGDLPVVGDWNNDGRDDPGIFRASQSPSTFYLDINHDAGADWVISLSGSYPQDVPVAGDWDGDGDSDVGAWDSNTRIFYLFRITSPSTLTDHASFQMGNPGNIPFAGNWDGTGGHEVGVFRPGDPNANTNTFYFRMSDGSVVSLTTILGGMPGGWGNTGDVPIVGDWNNDGFDTIGLYRPSTQQTFLNNDLPYRLSGLLARGDHGRPVGDRKYCQHGLLVHRPGRGLLRGPVPVQRDRRGPGLDPHGRRDSQPAVSVPHRPERCGSARGLQQQPPRHLRRRRCPHSWGGRVLHPAVDWHLHDRRHQLLLRCHRRLRSQSQWDHALHDRFASTSASR